MKIKDILFRKKKLETEIAQLRAAIITSERVVTLTGLCPAQRDMIAGELQSREIMPQLLDVGYGGDSVANRDDLVMAKDAVGALDRIVADLPEIRAYFEQRSAEAAKELAA